MATSLAQIAGKPLDTADVARCLLRHLDVEYALLCDGDLATLWNAGAGPTQSIEIALDGPRDVGEVRLVVAQSPAGASTHTVYWFGPHTSGAWLPLHRFVGSTADGDVLAFVAPEPWQDLSRIRVETTRSPSWVAWREIQVLEAG